MAVIKSGSSVAMLDVDATSKAARVTLYDAVGNVVSTLPVSLAIAAAPSVAPVGSVSLGNTLGKVNVARPGSLATVAVTADQVVNTYTVTAAKTLFLLHVSFQARLTVAAATATFFGTASLETPAGTKLYTVDLVGAGTDCTCSVEFTEPLAVPAGTVVRTVCTPSAVTSTTWKTNLVGYEK